MAWPDTRRPSDALTSEFVPERWSAQIINHVRSNLVSVNLVNTTWKAELAMGDKVYIPVISSEMSASTVDVTATTAISGNMNTSAGATTAESISIDHWKEVPVMIDDSTKRQTQAKNLLSIMADNAAYALEKAIDAEVHALFSGLSSSLGVYGADGQTFEDDLLIAIMEGLDEAEVPRTDRALVGDPSMLADLYKIDKYMSYDYGRRPVGMENIQQGGQGGYRGMIVAYDLPFYVTNHLTVYSTGNVGCLLHRDAIGLAVQAAPDVEAYRAPVPHSDVVNISAMWGEDEIRDTFGRAFYTRKK